MLVVVILIPGRRQVMESRLKVQDLGNQLREHLQLLLNLREDAVLVDDETQISYDDLPETHVAVRGRGEDDVDGLVEALVEHMAVESIELCLGQVLQALHGVLLGESVHARVDHGGHDEIGVLPLGSILVFLVGEEGLDGDVDALERGGFFKLQKEDVVPGLAN